MSASTIVSRSTTERSNRGLVARYPLAAYFALAYALSWAILVPAGLGLIPESAGGILSWVAPFGPAAAAFVVTALIGGGPAVRQLLRRIGQWRVGVGWYLLILVGVPLLELLGAFAVLGSVPLDELSRNWPVILLLLPTVLYIFVFTGLGEEPGWRGFALPRLQERHGPLLGTSILAVLWALWHLPNVLFGGYTGLSYTLWAALTVASAFLYTWVYNRTGGSVLIAALLHGAINGGSGIIGARGLLPSFDDALHLHRYGAIALAFGVVALVLVVTTRGRLAYGGDAASRPIPASRTNEESPSPA
jgi:uncharacterized protein